MVPSYCAYENEKLVRPLDRTRKPSALEEFVHDSFRSLILNPKFSCVGAKSSIRSGDYRIGTYGSFASEDTTVSLARDLISFIEEQKSFTNDFSSFIACFNDPTPLSEMSFERKLWQQLQALSDLDPASEWDPAVSADPDDPNFSFSFGGRAFFVVGLHPSSSRFARRFAWPTLVFNAHEQFDELRRKGKYARMQSVIRAREAALQGTINANLTDFGERSEATQYSGRVVEGAWKCPFHRKSA